MSKTQAPKKAASKVQQHRMRGGRGNVLSIGFGAVLLVMLLSSFGALDLVEFKTQDWRFQKRGSRPMELKAAVVAIDDESLNGWLDAKGNPAYLPERWPFPRDFYGKVIEHLKAAGAKLIVFDIVFSESSKRDPKQDLIFAASAKAAGNVIFGEREVPHEENGSLKTETLIPPLDKAKLDKGLVNVVHTSDGYLRSMQPLMGNSNHQPDPDKNGLDLAVFRHLVGYQGKAVFDAASHSLKLGDRTIPLRPGGTVLVNFCGPAGTVPTVPFHDVYNNTGDMSQFKDRVVYIGATTDVLHDNHFSPFSAKSTGVEDFPGVEAHAHFLETLLTGRYINELDGWQVTLIVALVGAMTTLLTYRVKAIPGAIVSILFAVAYVIGVRLAFEADWMLPLVAPVASVAASYIGIATYRGWYEEKRARETKQMFSRYVSHQIVEEILKNPDAVGTLGGEMKEVTILFSDVRSFTAMSEKLSAPQVVEVLNEYLTAMVDIVMANNGTLDKYVGDAIMAVWGSPLPDPKQKENALRTAVQMMEVLQELQKKWAVEGKPRIDIGIGLNSGHVVAGNMGHHDYKMDYTVIGDDVNLAARMESANKEMRSHVLITGSTYEGNEDLVDIIRHPPIHVKGKEKAVDVIEVIGWKKQGRAPWAVPLPEH